MATIVELKEQASTFVNNKFSEIMGNSIQGRFWKPVLEELVRNNIDKADTFLNILADKNGNIDALGMIQRYEDSLINSKEIISYGIVRVGDGKIKIDVPGLEKILTFDSSDLEELKQLLTKKNYVDKIQDGVYSHGRPETEALL